MAFQHPMLKRAAQAYVLLVLLGVCFVAWAVTGNPERHALTALLQYVPYFAYLLPALAGCVVALGLSWAWRGMVLGALVMVLTVIMGLCVGSPEDGQDRLRVMSYNAKVNLALDRPNGMADLIEEIITHDPDVLLMQDAQHLLPLEQSNPDLFRAVIGQRDVYTFGQYVVASRYPLKDCRPDGISFRDVPHTFVRCVLSVRGHEIDLVNVHFLTPRQGLNAVRKEGVEGVDDWQRNMLDRLIQSRELASKISRMKRPRIIAGDLNAPERSMVVRNLLYTGLRDAYSSAALGYGYTHGHSFRFGVSFNRIDHILVSDEIGVGQAYIGGAKGSEHRPVIADLWLKRPQRKGEQASTSH